MADWKPPDGSQRSDARRRRVGPRPKVISGRDLIARVMTARQLDSTAIREALDADERPQTRSDCVDGPRPCPWVGCRHHLYLSVNEPNSRGHAGITINFPDREPWELRETCALDVADRGGVTLEEVGELVNLTRERIRQIEARALRRLKRHPSTPER